MSGACSLLSGFDLGACISGYATDTWHWLVSFVPLGDFGLGLIVGALFGAWLGWKGLGVLAALWGINRFFPRPVPSEQQYPHPDAPPVPKPHRKTLFGK